MAGYIIVQVEVTDPEKFELYRTQVQATLEPYGGQFLVRGGEQESLEGEWAAPRTVVIQFPDTAQAKAWHGSDVYAGPKALRQASAKTNMVVIEGI